MRCHGRFPYPTFSGTHADDVFDLGQRLHRRLGGRLTGFDRDVAFYVDFGRDVCVYGRLGGSYKRFDERIGGFVEQKRETHLVAVDADVVLNHTGFNNVFAGGGITHVFQCVENQLRI